MFNITNFISLLKRHNENQEHFGFKLIQINYEKPLKLYLENNKVLMKCKLIITMFS